MMINLDSKCLHLNATFVEMRTIFSCVLTCKPKAKDQQRRDDNGKSFAFHNVK